jgi:hypothetical protein
MVEMTASACKIAPPQSSTGRRLAGFALGIVSLGSINMNFMLEA